MTTDQLVAAARQLIAIRSTADRPGELQAALELVEKRLAGVPDVTVEHFSRNGKPSFLAYRGKTRPEKFKVLLNGHVDVVPAKPEQFTPYVKGDKLFGRGALDMKTAALILTDVFCALAPRLDYPLGLQIVTDEEVGGAHGTALQIADGVIADFVIAGEFTPPAAICTESRGICWAEITFTGLSAHGAYLWEGKNAVLQAQRFVQKLLADYPLPDHDVWTTTVNVASLDTGNPTFNRVPERAVLRLDVRYIAGDGNFAAKQSAERYFLSLDPAAAVTILQFEPSHYADPAEPLLTTLAAAAKTVTTQPAVFVKKHGAADIRFYSDQGVPAVAFGLQGKGIHGDEEYVEISSLQRYSTVLKTFLRTIG